MGDNGNGGEMTSDERVKAAVRTVANALASKGRRKRVGRVVTGALLLASVLSLVWAGFSLASIADALQSVAESLRSIATLGGG